MGVARVVGLFGHVTGRRDAEANLGGNAVSAANGRFVLAFDGALTNRAELRRSLGDDRETSDAELVLEAYARWGKDAVRRLSGPFAFGLWDTNDRTLLLARDPLGERPLYFTTSPNQLAFSSSLRGLVSAGFVSPTPSRRAVASFLATGAVAEPDTIFEGASPLPPGTLLEHREGHTRQTSFWELQLDPSGDVPAAARDLEEKLRRAVDASLAGDPVVLLGGGPYSRAVAALAARASRGRLRTFTLGFGEPNGAERAAESIARSLDADHHEVRLSGPDLLRWIEDALAGLDQPSAFGLGARLVARAARDAGFEAAISGAGGADVFGFLARGALFGPLLAASRLPSSALPLFDRAAKALAPLSDHAALFFDALHARGSLERTYTALTSLRTHAEVSSLVSPDVRDEALVPITVPESLEPLLTRGGIAPENACAALLITNHLRDTTLRDAADASLGHNLDLRHPLACREVIERAITLPRRAATSALSKSLSGNAPFISNKPNGLPLSPWLRGPLRPWAEHLLLEEPTRRLPFLDAEAIARSLRVFFHADHDHDASRVFSLLVLVAYFHSYAEGTGSHGSRSRS